VGFPSFSIRCVSSYLFIILSFPNRLGLRQSPPLMKGRGFFFPSHSTRDPLQFFFVSLSSPPLIRDDFLFPETGRVSGGFFFPLHPPLSHRSFHFSSFIVHFLLVRSGSGPTLFFSFFSLTVVVNPLSLFSFSLFSRDLMDTDTGLLLPQNSGGKAGLLLSLFALPIRTWPDRCAPFFFRGGKELFFCSSPRRPAFFPFPTRFFFLVESDPPMGEE